MSEKLQMWGITAVGLLGTFVLSYGLAMIGEPQALWFWRDIIGVL